MVSGIIAGFLFSAHGNGVSTDPCGERPVQTCDSLAAGHTCFIVLRYTLFKTIPDKICCGYFLWGDRIFLFRIHT